MNGNIAERVRVKICGITRPDDALLAAQLGADAIGLVFYKNSPRSVDEITANEIIASLPPFITKVGLFVDQEQAYIRSVLEKVPLDTLQFHGDESPEECSQFAKPYIKAVRMRNNIELADIVKKYDNATALLLDTYVEGVTGGTGQVFDWTGLPRKIDKPIILAGGLNSENVVAAIQQVRPYAVDVSSGVEISEGKKDPDKMAAFIQQVIRTCV